MQHNRNLYFIAIIPPPEIRDEITRFKQDMAERFDSSHALKTIPHITLKAPFVLPAENHEFVLSWFQNLRLPFESFIQELNGFDAFYNKRNPVIYVKPIASAALILLQKDLLLHFKLAFPFIPIAEAEKKFSPHMTIAYRDLTVASFKQAMEEYKGKPYKAAFEVNGFHLLQHNGKQWHVIHTFNHSQVKGERF